MIHIVLYQPQIPQNTGNIARLCYANQAHLHLIGPLGFSIDDKALKRAGLDYWPLLTKTIYNNWQDFCQTMQTKTNQESLSNWPIHPISTMGIHLIYDAPIFTEPYLLFGSEDSGLPNNIIEPLAENSMALPQDGPVRSLNLATSAGIVLYEIKRRLYYNT